jgi:hypothetical protein
MPIHAPIHATTIARNAGYLWFWGDGFRAPTSTGPGVVPLWCVTSTGPGVVPLWCVTSTGPGVVPLWCVTSTGPGVVPLWCVTSTGPGVVPLWCVTVGATSTLIPIRSDGNPARPLRDRRRDIDLDTDSLGRKPCAAASRPSARRSGKVGGSGNLGNAGGLGDIGNLGNLGGIGKVGCFGVMGDLGRMGRGLGGTRSRPRPAPPVVAVTVLRPSSRPVFWGCFRQMRASGAAETRFWRILVASAAIRFDFGSRGMGRVRCPSRPRFCAVAGADWSMCHAHNDIPTGSV